MIGTKLLFAGGGSGGHVFPLLSVAEAATARVPGVQIVFVGTERGMETRLVPARGYPLELVTVRPIRGGGLRGALEGVGTAAWSIPACLALVKRHAPAAVLSIGGYAAGPVALAARLLGIPVALIEPNAEIGLSNRLVAPMVTRAYTAFPQSARFFRPDVVMETGMPIRKGFFAVPYARVPGALRVLVFGGSQGARVLNQTVPRALGQLGAGVSVVHQCGPQDELQTRALYAAGGLGDAARVVPFIDDMHRAVAESDLVIGRAGAGTIGEICAVGRPSLLIPLPHAGDHQRFNAYPLVERGAAVCVLTAEATPERLVKELSALMHEPHRLETMAESARRFGRPDAASHIAEDLLRLASVGARSKPSVRPAEVS